MGRFTRITRHTCVAGLVLGGACGIALSCHRQGPTAPITLTVTPKNLTLTVGKPDSVVSATVSGGANINDNAIVWVSQSPGVASVIGLGSTARIHAVAGGDAQIVATYESGAGAIVDVHVIQPQTFIASLSAANEPRLAAPSQATGTATFQLTEGQLVLTSLVVQNIDSVTVAHIQVGAKGNPGPIVVSLLSLNTPSGHIGASVTLVSNLAIPQSAILSPDGGVTAPITLDSLVALFRNGGAFVNVHTRANPAGEIRGQIERQ